MKWVYHDPNKSLRKLVIRPGDFMVPRLDTKPTIPGPIPQAVPGVTPTGRKKRVRKKKITEAPINALKRGTGNWL